MTKDMGETDKFRAMMSRTGYTPTPPRNGNAPYLVAVVVSLLIAVAGSALVIFLRPDYDPIIIIAGIGTATGAVTTQLLQLIKLSEVEKKTEIAVVKQDETHKIINSQLSAALETARKAGYGAGMQAGEDKANQRTDELKAAQTSTSGRRADDPPEVDAEGVTQPKVVVVTQPKIEVVNK